MKKKMMTIVTLVAVMAMTTASLTGCGTRAEATDVTISEEDLDDTTIVVTDNATTESSTSDTNEITSTEVIGETENTEAAAFAGAETDSIVLYAEKESQRKFLDMYLSEYVANDGKVVATEDVPIYDGSGFQVGYIKNGAVVAIDETATDITWSRFENPIADTEYDYLYVMNDYLVNEDIIILTADEATSMIIDLLHQRSFDMPTILDAPTDDMEVHEFVLPKENASELDLSRALTRAINDNNTLDTLVYMTYCVECEEGTNVISCKLYYKDLYDK